MKFPAICTLISTGKTVVCSDAASFSTKSLVYGYPMDGGVTVTQDNAVEIFEEAKKAVEEAVVEDVSNYEVTMPNEFTCSKCSKVCASKLGLSSHQRKCNKSE